MTDEKRLRGESTHNITEGEKAAWQRSKGDAQRNDKLKNLELPIGSVLKIVELYAEQGDINAIALRLDLAVVDVNKTLIAFNIQSIEDARKLIRSGVVGDAMREAQQDIQDQNLEAQQDTQDAQDAHEKHQSRFDQSNQNEPAESVSERQKRAEQLNKQDRIREILSQGLKPRDPNAWRVPLDRINEFKSQLIHGVGYLQRQFGGSKKDIVNEIRRLSPETDTDTLRP